MIIKVDCLLEGVIVTYLVGCILHDYMIVLMGWVALMMVHTCTFLKKHSVASHCLSVLMLKLSEDKCTVLQVERYAVHHQEDCYGVCVDS